jgi:hypothetical protein
MSRKFKFNYYLKRRTGTLHDQYIFLIVSSSILLQIRNILNKVVVKIKTHLLCSITFLEIRAAYEIRWKNIVQPDRPQMKI